jgi:hypothetical protein
MSYFGCQFKEQGGYKMSTLKIIPEINIHILKPLQWRKIDIKQYEFEGINAMWLNRCKPRSNWTIEQWMMKLNQCINEYRKRQSTKKQSTKRSQLKKEIEVITPIENVQTIELVPVETTDVISTVRKGIIYDLVTDETNPIKQINDTIKCEIKEFITKRLNELQAKHGLNLECSIDFNLELYFE